MGNSFLLGCCLWLNSRRWIRFRSYLFGWSHYFWLFNLRILLISYFWFWSKKSDSPNSNRWPVLVSLKEILSDLRPYMFLVKIDNYSLSHAFSDFSLSNSCFSLDVINRLFNSYLATCLYHTNRQNKRVLSTVMFKIPICCTLFLYF